MPVTIKRPIRIEGELAYIPLTRGLEAVIDAADVPLVAAWNWCVCTQKRTTYAQSTDCSNGKSKTIYLHRVIMAPAPGLVVDHINMNALDNRRANLRIATHAQNMRNKPPSSTNRSGFKGVSFSQAHSKWVASIGLDGVKKHLGLFATAEQAASAYAEASKIYHGDFRRI